MFEYKVFCRDKNVQGHYWIESIFADDPNQAKQKGIIECADQWGINQSSIVCVSVMIASEIFFWEDGE